VQISLLITAAVQSYTSILSVDWQNKKTDSLLTLMKVYMTQL